MSGPFFRFLKASATIMKWQGGQLTAIILCLLACASTVRAEASDLDPRYIYIGFSLHELNISPSNRDNHCYVRGQIEYIWSSEQHPDFSPDDVEIFNAAEDVLKKPIANTLKFDPALQDFEVRTYLINGNFYAYNNFVDFPFDKHEIGIVFYTPERIREHIRFNTTPELIRYRVLFPALMHGWKADKFGFYAGSESYLHSKPAALEGEESAFCAVVIDVSRSYSDSLVRILIPIFIIWGLSFLGFFWKDSSPASRFGSSAMIAAVAYSLGIKNFIPYANYILAVNYLVLGLYLCIGINTAMVTWSFHAKGLGNVEKAEKIRRSGVMLGIACAAIVAIAFFTFAMLTGIDDGLFHEKPLVEIPITA